jgi:D-arabinose 1-dehydrogenase-like Zn-dependent alcohol dehydrogenase
MAATRSLCSPPTPTWAYVVPILDAQDFAESVPLVCADLTVYNGTRNLGFQPGVG